ncbi:Uncharacterised protein [Chlamydia trachomatis]|nr:Uncharacterised protein [Chlamydia trachomatis]
MYSPRGNNRGGFFVEKGGSDMYQGECRVTNSAFAMLTYWFLARYIDLIKGRLNVLQ